MLKQKHEIEPQRLIFTLYEDIYFIIVFLYKKDVTPKEVINSSKVILGTNKKLFWFAKIVVLFTTGMLDRISYPDH